MNAAIITNNIVVNLIVIDQEHINAYSTSLPIDTIIVVSDVAAMNDIYDPVTGSFSKQGEVNGN